ncbi:MAG: amidohydrolase family protein [Clostridia bacterium]|nr:amidohydrolase family protein [Clostridia bacterium]
MIIDAHNHPDWLNCDFDAFIRNMNECGIDKTWLLTWEMPMTEAPVTGGLSGLPLSTSDRQSTVAIPFSRVLSYAERAPERFILGYAPDPRRPEAIACLKSAVDIYNVQVCGEVKLRMHYDNPDAVELFRACGDLGLPVTLHFDYPEANTYCPDHNRRTWWYGGAIENLEHLLQLCPKTNFLGHAPGFWGHISGDDLARTVAYPKGPVLPGGKIEELLTKYPNLYCDMSAGSARIALSRDMDYSYALINRFSDRFLYARDCFDNEHRELIEKFNFSPEVKEAIYSGNALRLIRK